MILYHGGTETIEKPEIRTLLSTRDFGRGFYCTDIKDQAERWARRQGRNRNQEAILNKYEFDIDNAHINLNYKDFIDYNIEWLNLIINCRKTLNFKHDFDIVFGKIANDDVGETVQFVIDGIMPPDLALQRLAFMQANNQYCFCTEKSLAFIKFTESIKLE